MVQANMPNNLWHHESVALQGEPMRFMWCTGEQRSELQPDPQKLNVSCISVAEKGCVCVCSRLDTAGQGHTEAQLDHVLPQTVSFGKSGLRLLLLDANLTHLARGNFNRDIAFISLARGCVCGVGGIFLIADRCGRLWPRRHRRGGWK